MWWGQIVALCTVLGLGVGGHSQGVLTVTGLALVLAVVQRLRARSSGRKTQRLLEDTDAVLGSFAGGLLTIDLEGRIRNFNPAAERILGLEAQAVRGRTLEEAFASRAPLLYQKLAGSLQDSSSVHRHELQVAQAGGNTRPIGLSTSLLRTSDGQVRGLLASFQDLSDVRRMQERVRRADRLAAVGELAAGIAHEIRNPLSAISNSIDVLRDDLPVRGEDRRLMDIVVKESERLNRILDDFLEYARSRPLQESVVPVGRALDEVVTLLRCHPDIGDDLHIRLDDRTARSIYVCIDEGQMKQVYVNLALNAFEAMQHRGTLVITVETCLGDEGAEETSYVRLGFRDLGPGLEPGQEASIFEPFHTTKPQGTGLGLSIAARIVEGHGGRMEAVTVDGGGAEFSVFLPEADPADEDEKKERVISTAATETSGSR